jgi:hypothetical protein
MPTKEQFMSVWFGKTPERCICKRVVAKEHFTPECMERWAEIARRKGLKVFYFYCHADQQLRTHKLMQP